MHKVIAKTTTNQVITHKTTTKQKETNKSKKLHHIRCDKQGCSIGFTQSNTNCQKNIISHFLNGDELKLSADAGNIINKPEVIKISSEQKSKAGDNVAQSEKDGVYADMESHNNSVRKPQHPILQVTT